LFVYTAAKFYPKQVGDAKVLIDSITSGPLFIDHRFVDTPYIQVLLHNQIDSFIVRDTARRDTVE